MPDETAAPDELLAQARSELAAVKGKHVLNQLNQLKSRYLGRRGIAQQQLHAVGKLPPAERAEAGAAANALRAALEALFAKKKQQLQFAKAVGAMIGEYLDDVTLPGRVHDTGASHPLSLTVERALSILAAVGFETAHGPEIETDYYNFTALNQPPDHPARSMQDTLYLRDSDHVLRTHTSPVQIRHMEKCVDRLPIRAVSPGRVYRRDAIDATHSPMFHQIEGLWVDKQVRFTDLKGILGGFFRRFFADDEIEIRFRPSFFPFTEPSAECDMRRHGKWLEVAGCGMVHPNVLAAAGIDASVYRGFAFGMGVERLAMLFYGVTDIRLFFENDVRFLAQFGR